MKISKRQLKRIIREEYARLYRRGLLKEAPRGSWAEFIDLCQDPVGYDAAGDWIIAYAKEFGIDELPIDVRNSFIEVGEGEGTTAAELQDMWNEYYKYKDQF